ncbi:class E sortase [Microbacterium thalli]|uniref:class E sortase n=1 Tax=Microbacterium thalli TaxID=3027921 RepID=UPI0023657FDE|nr:class E sortase [Microbacterium thalli]MDD7928281.1 class E sortase [Microbacterium thalli]
METEPHTRRSRRPARPRPSRPRRRTSVVGVLGELLLTAGVVMLLFVSWQMWFGDMIISSQKQAEASALAQQWADAAQSAPPSETPEPAETSEAPAEPAPPVVPVLDEPGHGAEFGIMYIPRFGPDWQFKIASGTAKKSILDAGYIGHYEGSAMPGAEGNMAVAAHRWTSGAPFDPVDRLVIGDAVVIQTQDGWYTYRFRNVEYVQDTAIEVLNPVPQQVDLAANGRYLTLTSCAPKLNMLERIISYAVFEEFTPTSAGPPASLSQGAPA